MKSFLVIAAVLLAVGPAVAAKARSQPVHKPSPWKVIPRPAQMKQRKEARPIDARRGKRARLPLQRRNWPSFPDAVWHGPPEIWKVPSRHS